MNILVTDINEPWQQEYLSSRLPGHTITFVEGDLSLEVVDKSPDAEVLSVFVTSSVSKEVIDALPNLKYITTRSTGFDHIDLEVAEQRGIPVSNVPFYGENTVAEHAMSLLLALARKLPESFARIEDGKFDYHGLRGWDVKGKTVGVIGGGHIGMNFARMCVGFGMDVLVFDIKPNEELATEVGVAFVELDELYSRSDVISLHVPLNPHTAHMINAEAISKMKQGVYLINTARGDLINTDDLIVALRDGKVAGAGLDVLEGEDFLQDELDLIGQPKYKEQLLTLLEGHVLMEMENVIVTPHNAFNSTEAVERILQTTVENIESLDSGDVINKVVRS